MNEPLTDRTRKVLQLANQEAQRSNHRYIGSEHLLLGLMKEGSCLAAVVLKNLGLDIHQMRKACEKLRPVEPVLASPGVLPQIPGTRRILQRATQTAELEKQQAVSTEHLLLALVMDEDSNAILLLRQLGVSADQVRAELGRLKPSSPCTPTLECTHADLPLPAQTAIASQQSVLDAHLVWLSRLMESAVANKDMEQAAEILKQMQLLRGLLPNLASPPKS